MGRRRNLRGAAVSQHPLYKLTARVGPAAAPRTMAVSREERTCLLLEGAVLGRCPDGQDKCDLVHEVSEVVDKVQGAVVDGPHKVAEEVTQWIDGPANGDNEAHGIEGGLHMLVRFLGGPSQNKDLEEDEAPTAHARNEAKHGRHELRLARVARRKHEHGAEKQAQEH